MIVTVQVIEREATHSSVHILRRRVTVAQYLRNGDVKLTLPGVTCNLAVTADGAAQGRGSSNSVLLLISN